MRQVEAQVIQVPTHVILVCPECHNEMKRTYGDFCDEFGEPCDWMFSKTKCSDCGIEFEIDGSAW